MRFKSSGIVQSSQAISRTRTGLAWGLLGVIAFSFTVPMTSVAVGGLSPLLVGSARAVIAAALAGLALAATRQRRPRGDQWVRLAIVGGGVAVGFPLLTSYALEQAPASHAAVVTAVLPAATAATAVWRTGERPPPAFWRIAALGALAAIAFASLQGDGFGRLHVSDLLLLGAVAAAAIGYAEGGLLARELGAWQTVSWALLVCAPATLALTAVAAGEARPSAAPLEWAAFAYLAAVSMYLGYFAWYRGLAIGPIARVSQVQLVQPVLTVLWAALLLRESLGWATVAGGVAVIACAAATVRVRGAGAARPEARGASRRRRRHPPEPAGARRRQTTEARCHRRS